MVNLLPEEERSTLTLEYRLRLAAVSLFFVSALFVVASLLFVPSYLLSSGRQAAALWELTSLEKALALRDANALDAALLDTKRKIETLRSRGAAGIRGIVETIAGKRSSDLTIRSFMFQAGSSGGTVDISGRAASRESLLLFTRKLEHETGAFSAVNLPISNFAKQTDISFNLGLKLVAPKKQ
ncbi:MAG: hypothetical protein G01um101472_346 [Parcubacteria group bacterium Gr01-1014_72]|nr:MAG: hypothetical protein G01um101472_346 [Parcubacteria group bacterium Gr01-1014_72]